MNAQELITMNNEKRKELTKENLKYYEDMIVYIRLSFNKSELETEEILSELLDHLLTAQNTGKTAKDVFGDNPKEFADEIIGELPKMVTKERTLSLTMAILYFLGVGVIVSGIWDILFYYIFHIGKIDKTIYVESFLLETLISIPFAFLFMYLIIQLFRWTCFRKLSKVMEFMLYFVYSVFSMVLFIGIYYFIPDFGYEVEIPAYITILFGVILFILATYTKRALTNK